MRFDRQKEKEKNEQQIGLRAFQGGSLGDS